MSGNKAQTQNLPDIPSPQDIVEGKKVTQAWREWFYVLQLKVNSITGNVLNFFGLTGTGLLIQTGSGTYANRKLVAGTNITITNPDGVVGDIIINAVNGSNFIYPLLLTTLAGVPLVTLEGDFILEMDA